jgi:DNA-binding NarL/FixJ family response regulator
LTSWPIDESPPAQLTAREQAVLALVADAKSNKEIATVLALAENTVKNCLKNIRAKLHLENRVQVAVFAVNHSPLLPLSRTTPVVNTHDPFRTV